jgi:GDP-mannose 6-dehydrogenase
MNGLDHPAPQTVAVFGLGYVGCVSAACLSHIGHRVIGVDRDDLKVRSLQQGRAPFFEPGLEDLVRQHTGTRRLQATATSREALVGADIALVCVGTPSERNGNLGLEQLRRVVADIAASAAADRPLIVVIRSTVFPGTCEEVVLPAFSQSPQIRVVANPEFLREGCAVRDFLEPSLIVAGGELEATRRVVSLYDSLGVESCLVSLRAAEMIKYACNAFHAVKIDFANEIAALAARMGVSGTEVMDTLCRDTRLNISPAYLRPGFAFGGSCLPKDLRALNYRAARLDLRLPLLEAALGSNDQHLLRGIQAVLDLPGRIGVLGLTFKEDTDDLRESPVVTLLEHLIGKGREVRVFDPHLRLDVIYGSNKNYILNAIPHIGALLDESIESLLGWANHLVVTQKLSAAIAGRVRESSLPVLDLSGTM